MTCSECGRTFELWAIAFKSSPVTAATARCQKCRSRKGKSNGRRRQVQRARVEKFINATLSTGGTP